MRDEIKIPRRIYESDRLNSDEKLLYGLILRDTRRFRFCSSTDEEIAVVLGWKLPVVCRSMWRLKQLNFVDIENVSDDYKNFVARTVTALIL